MKVLLLIMLTTFSFASTKYKTPVFVVENSTLYCLKHEKYKNNELVEYNTGDLVSGDYASRYCSYNFESITDRIDARVLELKLKAEEEKKNEKLAWIWFIFIVIMLFSINIYVFTA